MVHFNGHSTNNFLSRVHVCGVANARIFLSLHKLDPILGDTNRNEIHGRMGDQVMFKKKAH